MTVPTLGLPAFRDPTLAIKVTGALALPVVAEAVIVVVLEVAMLVGVVVLLIKNETALVDTFCRTTSGNPSPFRSAMARIESCDGEMVMGSPNLPCPFPGKKASPVAVRAERISGPVGIKIHGHAIRNFAAVYPRLGI